MKRQQPVAADTAAFARSMRAAADQPDAIIGKNLARKLWAALKAREGAYFVEFLSQDAMEILDPPLSGRRNPVCARHLCRAMPALDPAASDRLSRLLARW